MGKAIAIYFVFTSAIALGQSKNIHDLLNELAYAKGDTIAVKLYLELGDKYVPIDLDSAMYYNTLGQNLIEKIDAKDHLHKCLHTFVKIHHGKREFTTALEYCLKAIKVAQENKNRFQEATSYRALFNLYHNLNMNDSAVKYAVYSMQLTTEIRDTANITANYGNLCWLYKDLNQYDKAIAYGMKGIKSGEQYADTIGLLIALNNTALCYLEQNDQQKAVELFSRQYELGKLANRPRSVRNALVNLGVGYFHLGSVAELDRTAALLNDYNKNDPSLSSEYRCLQCINNSYNSILQKKFQEAEEQLFECLKIAKADSLNDRLLTIYITLSKLKFATHDFPAGNFYEAKWDSLDQKQFYGELSEYEAELEKKYESEKKSAKIILQDAQLRQKSIVNYLLTGVGVSLLTISLLVYRTYSQKQKLQQRRINELETEKQLMATEAVLKGEEKERSRLAKDLHDGLGGMLSGIKYSFNSMKQNLVMTPENHQAFERSMDMLDSSMKEMRRVAHNMMPESLVKFGLDTALKDFCHDINQSGALKVDFQSIGLADKQFDQRTAITVYRIVQELINNTMKHAAARTAIVQVSTSGKQLSVTVEDDGKGFDTAILRQAQGIGWSNIQHRVDFLKGKLDVDSQPGKGTSVQIEFDI
ncbi:MAG TPA: sensor histidine kinase [Chryseolinea sp.]|nr:sensor histidine kinase [Chryseolinea sp.]